MGGGRHGGGDRHDRRHRRRLRAGAGLKAQGAGGCQARRPQAGVRAPVAAAQRQRGISIEVALGAGSGYQAAHGWMAGRALVSGSTAISSGRRPTAADAAGQGEAAERCTPPFLPHLASRTQTTRQRAIPDPALDDSSRQLRSTQPVSSLGHGAVSGLRGQRGEASFNGRFPPAAATCGCS